MLQTVFFEIFLDTDDYDDYEYEGLEEDDYEADTVTGNEFLAPSKELK